MRGRVGAGSAVLHGRTQPRGDSAGIVRTRSVSRRRALRAASPYGVRLEAAAADRGEARQGDDEFRVLLLGRPAERQALAGAAVEAAGDELSPLVTALRFSAAEQIDKLPL